MPFIKKFITIIICITVTSSLNGCATTYDRGHGVVIAEKKIKDRDYKPHQATQTGAVAGATVGGVGGAVGGGILGLSVGAIAAGFSNNMAILAATTLGGAAIGAVIFGVAGTAIGSGFGYVVDSSAPGAGVYEFVVQSDNEKKPLTITQYTAPIPLNTPVHILEKDNLIFIKK